MRLITSIFRSYRKQHVKVTKSIGFLLLGGWLIATGLIPLLHLSFSGLGLVMSGVAIAAGVLIIIGR
jgi:hypothetical protein